MFRFWQLDIVGDRKESFPNCIGRNLGWKGGGGDSSITCGLCWSYLHFKGCFFCKCWQRNDAGAGISQPPLWTHVVEEWPAEIQGRIKQSINPILSFKVELSTQPSPPLLSYYLRKIADLTSLFKIASLYWKFISNTSLLRWVNFWNAAFPAPPAQEPHLPEHSDFQPFPSSQHIGKALT